MQATAAVEPPLGMLDVQYNLRTQPGRVRCSTCRPVKLRGCRREQVSIGDDETLCPEGVGEVDRRCISY